MKKLSKAAEELKHIEAAKGGNRRSVAILLKKYDNLCYKLAKKYSFSFSLHELEDLAQEGRMGLVRAIETYQLGSKASFFTWSYYCVRGAISRVTRSSNKKDRYHLSIEDSQRAYNVEDRSQNPHISDDHVQRTLVAVCKGAHTENYKLLCDRLGVYSGKKMSLKRCGEKYNMNVVTVSKLTKDLLSEAQMRLTNDNYVVGQ